MSEKTVEKKKWSKKKKIVVIILSVLLALIVLAVIAGVCVLNWYCKTEDYTLQTTNQNVTLVAHRGYRSVAPENTTAAFEEAGKAGFWGAECDIYRTKDGVWVVTHDTNTYRMMDKMSWVEKKTYDELLTETVDNGANIEKYPNLKICSLEEYLQICSKYNMTAVIELKGKNNTEYYSEIIDMVSEYSADAVYISFHFENLQKIRELTDAPVYYLVQKIEEEDIELAKTLENCGIDFNGEKEENFETDIIKQCIDSGLAVGAWTIDDTETLDKLVDYGVTLITTDCITSDRVKLIAHRGYSAAAPENTTASFEAAGKAGFWGAECDIYQTKDGVWVVSHDESTDRMMNKSLQIESETYETLSKLTVDSGANVEKYPNLKICTLEEYLKICSEYNMVAVIELKSENNTNYENIVDFADEYNVKCVYLSDKFENLQKIRELTDSTVYYLAQVIKEEDIDLVKSLKNCGIDFNAGREENFETDIIKQCIDSGIKVGAWTIDDKETFDKLIDYGVTLITTNSITKEDLS